MGGAGKVKKIWFFCLLAAKTPLASTDPGNALDWYSSYNNSYGVFLLLFKAIQDLGLGKQAIRT